MTDQKQLCVSAIRVVSAEAIQKANSGHPGIVLGAAPMAFELFSGHLRHDPACPDWPNRDRFILSAGHGSMLLYSLLLSLIHILPTQRLGDGIILRKGKKSFHRLLQK